jgi:hypothetical protein
MCDRQNKAENYGLRSLQRTLKQLYGTSLREQGYELVHDYIAYYDGSVSLKPPRP